MRLTKHLILLAALLFIVACAFSQVVHYNYDRAANFGSYKTYQWVDILDGAVPDQLIDQSIKRAIDEQFAQKGLTRVEADADLKIGYRAVIREEKNVNLSAFGVGGGPWSGFGNGPWGGGSGTVIGQTSTAPVGTLLVDVYDAGKKQLIWRGDATKTIDLKKDPNKNYKTLQKVMTKLFKNYPPQANK